MQLLETIPNQLLNSLRDISQKVWLNYAELSITHADYEPLETPIEVKERFQNVSAKLKEKYFAAQVRNFLYGIYYNGSLKNVLKLGTNSIEQQPQKIIENNTFLGINLKFYEQLHRNNCGNGYFEPGWTVCRQESEDDLAVVKDNLTLHIEKKRHLKQSELASVGDFVSIRMPKNRVQNGFYMAIGDAGSNIYPETVRIYFNLTAEGAVAVMKSLTYKLNRINVPFNFKVLYDPSVYYRHDSGVLYFERSQYLDVKKILTEVYAETQSYFKTAIPLFTKLLAPGLALAEEPNLKFTEKESFGTNRCQIVGNGLLAAYYSENNSPQEKMDSIIQQFSLLGIDWQRPYLNSNSKDIYTLLDI